MLTYLVLLLALLSRLIPPLLHLSLWSRFTVDGTLWNFTAVGGTLLFFGARRARWQGAIAVLALMTTDYLLTVYAYHYPFHISSYLVTWAWYAGACLLGHKWLRRVNAIRVTGAVLASSTSFFLLSNFMVWTGSMYAHSVSGLALCYFNGLPFYRNDLASTALVASVLFGLPALASSFTKQPAMATAS
jgi:hypothetical protein